MAVGITVVGLGRAGEKRVRDILASPRFVLRGTVSRRDGVGTMTFAGALADPGVQALALCTENCEHEEAARRALAAGKHLLVEYPLALSEAAVEELFALAERERRIIHEGHVELWSDGYQALRGEVRARGPLREGEVRFTGGNVGWVGIGARAGFASFAGIARLHRLVDLFGFLRVRGATYAPRPSGYRLEATLETAGGALLSWSEERDAGLARANEMRFVFASGAVVEGPRGSAGPVFARDLEQFGAELAGEEDPGPERERSLHCAALAAEIERRCHISHFQSA
jgi:biliverdin reductase